MMLNKMELNIMDELMQAITQTDAWSDLQRNDPLILRAENELNGVLERVRPLIPKELFIELSDCALGAIASAYGEAGILYGIRVADTIRDAAADPIAVAEHVLQRTERAAS